MALTSEGALLTEAHRLAQANIAADTVAELTELWPLLDPADLDLTTARWLSVAVPLVERQAASSAALAREYLTRFRTAEAASASAFAPLTIALPPSTQIGTSLVVTGPVTIRTATALGTPQGEAAMEALARSGAAAGRLALLAGRRTIVDSSEADPSAYGYRRVTSAGCCAFCAMLAARSYSGLSSDFFKAHDGCHCQPETAYHLARDTAPRQAKNFADLYANATTGVGGGGTAKLNAFRKALTASRTS